MHLATATSSLTAARKSESFESLMKNYQNLFGRRALGCCSLPMMVSNPFINGQKRETIDTQPKRQAQKSLGGKRMLLVPPPVPSFNNVTREAAMAAHRWRKLNHPSCWVMEKARLRATEMSKPSEKLGNRMDIRTRQVGRGNQVRSVKNREITFPVGRQYNPRIH